MTNTYEGTLKRRKLKTVLITLEVGTNLTLKALKTQMHAAFEDINADGLLSNEVLELRQVGAQVAQPTKEKN